MTTQKREGDNGLIMISCAVGLILGAMIGMFIGATQARDITYEAVRDGRATITTYTVPGQGECTAILINGNRRAEKCQK